MGKQFEHSHEISHAKTGAGRRAIAAKLPKTIESAKNILLLYGHATSNIGKALLTDLHIIKKPHCRKLTRKNDLMPFESGGETHLENLCRLNDSSLFAVTNHTKKRPDNLVLGRTFAFRILDMFEFGIEHFQPLQTFARSKSAPGSAPLLIFNGADYAASETTRIMQSLFLDLFRAPDDAKAINLAGIDRVIVLTLHGNVSDPSINGTLVNSSGKPTEALRVQFRQYEISLTRRRTDDDGDKNVENSEVDDENEILSSLPSGFPGVKLTEAGPRFDLRLRRVQMAPETLRAEAMKKPKDPLRIKKKKNVSRDEMGDKVGRVHVGRQDLAGLSLARMKGLGKKRKLIASQAAGEDGKIIVQEKETESGGDTKSENPRKKVRFEGVESPTVDT